MKAGMAENELRTEDKLSDKMMQITEEDILRSTLLAYKEIYFVYLDGNGYRMVYPKNGTKTGGHNTIENCFQKDGKFSEEEKDIREFLSLDNIRNELTKKDVIDYKYRRNLGNGESEWCLLSLMAGERKQGIPKTATILIRNIDDMVRKEEEERQELAAAVKRAEKDSLARMDFLSQVTHDIRTPLNVIIGMSSIAEKAPEDKNRVQDCMEKINTSGKHLLTLVNEILDLSKIENGKMQLEHTEFSLNEVMNEIAMMTQGMTAAKRQKFTMQFNPIVNEAVTGDKNRLIQIILNLISNAVKYSDTQANIEIEAKELPDERCGYGRYCFTVKDNGIGMSAELVEHIFEPYVRGTGKEVAQCTGTGLGMAIVKKLVQQMGGTVSVESREGVGTKASVCIPFLQRKNDLPDQTAKIPKLFRESENEGKLFPKQIHALLAEDNELNAEIAVDLLKDFEVSVTVAANGKDAYDAVLQAEKDTFDCIFMDMEMPVMDGMEAAIKIRESGIDGKELPIFAMTAGDFDRNAAEIRTGLIQESIGKPIDTKRLSQILTAYFS